MNATKYMNIIQHFKIFAWIEEDFYVFL